MDVVRIIAQSIDGHRRGGRRQISFIDRHRGLVVRKRVEIPADPIVDVARHVHEVACAGEGAAQPVGMGLGAFRPVRRLHGVNVVVNRAGMVRILGEHALQCGHDGDALRVRLAPAGLPVVPWAEIHDGLGVENRDFVVLREFRGDLAHGPGIRGIQRLAVRPWVLRVARRDRRNQRLLARACLGGERPRLLCRGKGGRHGLVLHRQIDVGAEHECLAPEAHGARRVELLRLAKGTLRLAVIERVGQAQALVEIGLRRRVRGRDLVAHRA